MTVADMVPFIGPTNRVDEVLNRRRPLTLHMIRRLTVGLRIPCRRADRPAASRSASVGVRHECKRRKCHRAPSDAGAVRRTVLPSIVSEATHHDRSHRRVRQRLRQKQGLLPPGAGADRLRPAAIEILAAVTGSSDVAGFGVAPKPDFWIAAGQPNVPPIHIAFRVETRAEVDAFHAAALAAGGSDNGGPGLRPRYHADYFGAFVRDPDGHNIEAVCHAPA